MKKFLKSLLAIILVISIAFSASVVQAEAFVGFLATLGTALIISGVGIAHLDKHVWSESTQTSSNISNISTDEWVYLDTGKDANFYIHIVDGIQDDIVGLKVERKSGNSWYPAKIDCGIWDESDTWKKITGHGTLPYEKLKYAISTAKRLKVVNEEDNLNVGIYLGAVKFGLEDFTKYRIKVVMGLSNNCYNNISIYALNSKLSKNSNSSATASNSIVNSFKEVFSNTITASSVTYKSANYVKNQNQIYNNLSSVSFGNLSIDSSAGVYASFSTKIKNPSSVYFYDYGLVLQESNGAKKYTDRKGATSSNNINYNGTIYNLTPNTYYTGMMYANTSYGSICSQTFSFKTPLIPPPKTQISSAKTIDYRTKTEINSTEMGIGDNVSVKWQPAAYADYYTISVNGVEDSTKIYGISKIFSLNEAGVKSIRVRAHNAAGSGEWSDALNVTVHPDVNITFHKDSDVYQKTALTWNHDLEKLPEIPIKYNSTFKGWYYDTEASSVVSFKNIKADFSAYAAYDINKYLVQFNAPDGTPIGKPQVVEHGNPAVEPDREVIDSYVKDGRKFIGWNKDISSVGHNMTVTAVTDSTTPDLPIKITDVSAVRHSSSYVINCTIHNDTSSGSDYGRDIDNGRVVVALKTSQGKLVTTTESAAFFLKKDYVDIDGNIVEDKKTLEIVVPLSENGVNYTASQAEIYAIASFQSLVPTSNGKTVVDIVDADPWTDWTAVNKNVENPEENKIERVDYRSREFIKTSTNSAEERDRLVKEENWTFDASATTSYKDKNSGTWSKVKPSSGVLNYDYAEKTVTDVAATTVYRYKTYRYYNPYDGQYWYSYSSGWADRNGMSGQWLYKEISWALGSSGTVDGWTKYNADGYIWFSNSGNKNDASVYNPAVTHKEYREFDTVYTYYLNKWSDYSTWTTEPIKETSLIQVDTRTVYRYKEENIQRVEDNSGTQRTYEDDKFLKGNRDEFANKQLILAIYKVNEASDWTLEHIDQTVADTNGNYEFGAYKLREELTAETGDLTVVIGVEGSERPIYVGTIEAPKPKYNVEFVDELTGEIISVQSVEEGDDAVLPDAPVHEGYTFSHWDNCSTNIRHHFDNENGYPIKAVYNKNKYSVVWIDYVQGKYEIEVYEHGNNLVPPFGLIKSDEMNPGGWDACPSDSVVPVTSNMVITAQYEYKTFTIDFLDYDGNVIDTQTVKYGESPEMPEFDYNMKDYVLFGFKSKAEYAAEEAEQVMTASVEVNTDPSEEKGVESEDEQNDFIVVETYKVYNDCKIVPEFEYVETTATPTVSVKTGSYSTAQNVTIECETEAATIYYTLDGTDPKTSKTAIECGSPSTITVDESCQLRYYATAFNMNVSYEGQEWYAINTGGGTKDYIVKFASYDNDYVIYTGIVSEGAHIDKTLVPEAEGYTFAGAYESFEVTENPETGEITDITYSGEWNFTEDVVTSDAVLYLDYDINTYSVKFVDYDGTVIDSQTINFGDKATAPEELWRDGFVFVGWDTEEYLDVKENLIVNAKYVSEEEYVTISLNRSSYTMMSGNKYNLIATTTGNVTDPDIIWVSSDDKVAVVDDNGMVTAVGRGSAEIYAVVADNGETAICKINVVGNPSDDISPDGGSGLVVDSYGYIRGFAVITDKDTQEHYTETVGEIRTKFLNNDLQFVSINGNILGDDDCVGTGAVIKLMNGDEVIDSVTVVVSGDMDGDGFVTNRDASRISRYLVGKESPSEAQLVAMDVNGDGYVNNRDASVVSRFLVGKEAI